MVKVSGPKLIEVGQEICGLGPIRKCGAGGPVSEAPQTLSGIAWSGDAIYPILIGGWL